VVPDSLAEQTQQQEQIYQEQLALDYFAQAVQEAVDHQQLLRVLQVEV
jgi:hypothetical protein